MSTRKRGRKGTGSVFQDEQSWVGQVSVSTNGRRRRKVVRGKTKAEASLKLRQLQIKLADKRVGSTPDKETVRRYLEAWLDSLELEPSTILRYRTTLNQHVASREFADLRMSDLASDLGSQHVLELYRALRISDVSTSAIKKTHTFLHAAFEAARYSRVGFSRNPCDLPRNQRPKYKPLQEPRPFDAEEEAAFLAACEGDQFEALYVLALDAGMRQAELFALEWRDVDWAKSTIEVRRTLKDSQGGLIVGETKNKQRRAIRIAPTTLAALQRQQKAQLREMALERLAFCDRNGGYLRRQNFNRREFAKVLEQGSKASGLPLEGRTFHDLRHTMASLLLQEGEAITRVSQRLGHSTVRTTLEYYAHCLPQDEERPAARFEQRRRRLGVGRSSSERESQK